ncbi:hypothetical protein [Mycobacteroides chelonae]|uniref:RiboL-PSP-HEPN domain-containing protein n=1 Tax=Mycobacteroides chelonae TaxID=1774 RepID=A0AB73MHZ5_MYCCH|nr:hypothetical protein [Mycobacteroides chelonae]MBF9327702.1 hypothetical protein [Mycobacteroides chelonae]MBF9421880.1 hypothetical protein [Mycobacteroides chelonae]MBF9435930.1 hypothetical protein [Mycobacteroides chelonae]MBV6361793.1 hypothetical protein [Mycobacteroides chelonae]MEC4837576.1 hypothetical protein [Mycobacteroides chelonae]
MTTFPLPYDKLNQVAKIRVEATRIAAMVDRLPAKIFKGNNSSMLRQAALDSFYVNIRLLIEFLEVRPASGDLSASKTLNGWSTSFLSSAQNQQLQNYHKDTSKHVVHFTKVRVNRITVSSTSIRQVADAVLAVWDEFAKQSQHLLVPRTADLRKVSFDY